MIFCSNDNPRFPDCLQTDISNVGCNAQQFLPSFIEQVAGMGWVLATVGESWCAKSRNKVPLNAWEAACLSDVKMK